MKKLVISLAIGVVISSGFAVGGAATGGATEITQVLNWIQLLGINSTTVSQLETDLQIYENAVSQYNIAERNIAKIGSVFTNTPNLSSLTSLRSATKGLYGSLTSASDSATKLIQQVSLSGLTPDEFKAKVVGDRNSALSQNTQILMQQYLNSMDDVTSSYSAVQAYEAQIPGLDGHMQSLQMLNSQMDTLLTQNSRMMQTWAAYLGNNAVKQTVSQQDEQAAANASTSMSTANKTLYNYLKTLSIK